MLRDPRQQLNWKHPDRPLMAGMNEDGKGLNFSRVLSQASYNTYLVNMTIVSRLEISNVSSYDVRRSASKDIRNLRAESISLGSRDSICVLANHTQSPFDRGVTDDYIGNILYDTWMMLFGPTHAMQTSLFSNQVHLYLI